LQQQSPTKDTTVNLNISDDDGTAASFTCAIDDSSPADAQPCVSGQAFPGLKETPNPHVAYVYAFDSTLPTPNRSTAGTVSFVVDTTAPGSPSFTSQPPVQTNSTSASFTWTDDPTAVSSSCSLDGAVLAPCGATALPKAFSVSNLAQDGHSLLVVDKDAAGNTGSALWTWNVDLTPPPAPSIMTGPANPTDQTSATFTFQDEDATATFLCSVDGGSYSACISPYNVPSVADGAAHSFLVKAKDLAGNIGPASAPYQWTVDSSDSGPVQLSPVSFLTGPHAYSNVDLPTFTWLGLDDTTTGFLCAPERHHVERGHPRVRGQGDRRHQPQSGNALHVDVRQDTAASAGVQQQAGRSDECNDRHLLVRIRALSELHVQPRQRPGDDVRDAGELERSRRERSHVHGARVRRRGQHQPDQLRLDHRPHGAVGAERQRPHRLRQLLVRAVRVVGQ
jgi:hypothetical protein